MRRTALGLVVLAVAVCATTSELITPAPTAQVPGPAVGMERNAPLVDGATVLSEEELAYNHIQDRRQDDLAAVETFRPGYAFWQHIFTIADGSIAFGSAVDG